MNSNADDSNDIPSRRRTSWLTLISRKTNHSNSERSCHSTSSSNSSRLRKETSLWTSGSTTDKDDSPSSASFRSTIDSECGDDNQQHKVRSCMKENTRSNRAPQRCFKKLRFADFMVKNKKSQQAQDLLRDVQIIQPYFEYSSDLWWTTEDVYRAKRVLNDTGNNDKIQSYIKAFMEGQNQTSISVNSIQEKIIQKKQQQEYVLPKLSIDIYENIVLGRYYGLAGFEMPTKSDRSCIIQSIINSYNTNNSNNNNNNKKYYYDCFNNNNDTIEIFAQSLTASDRYWATIIGQADMDAISSTTVIANSMKL